MTEKIIIGRETRIDFGKYAIGVPAKVDTGADGSAVWASHIRVDKEGRLCFRLFDEASPYYTGRVLKRTQYTVAQVKSASGNITLKFQAYIAVKICGRRIKVLFGLSDRSTHNYPVLIGCRTLRGKFIVDVAKNEGIYSPKKTKTTKLRKQLTKNPRNFYKNVYLKGGTAQ